MLALVEKCISENSCTQLAELQKEIDSLNLRKEQKELAKKMWENRTTNKTFDEIRQVLGEMCHGNQRCCYCEDNCATDIEHIYPKATYPEKTFVWENYLYVCGECNSKKSNLFPVFVENLKFIPAQLETSNYNSVLLNPRKDNPCEYLELDLFDTFQFVDRFDDDSQKSIRAKQTIEILGLNEGKKGEILIEQRKTAFESFCSHLYRYNEHKKQSHSSKLEKVKKLIAKTSHPTVWHEIKRYFKDYSTHFREKYEDIYEILYSNPELLEIENH